MHSEFAPLEHPVAADLPLPSKDPIKIDFDPDELIEEDKKKHDALVAYIAQNRFSYPSKQSPSLQTLVNRPRPCVSVRVSGSESLCPDVLVLNTVIGTAASICEVETKLTINNERALRWKKYESLKEAKFYLFVPQMQLYDVKALLRYFHVRVTGLRIYSFNYSGEPIITAV